jgi:perosamine synthetase
MHIPMAFPDLTAEDIAAVLAVLHTPALSIGPQIEAFEQAVAATMGVRHAVGINSGTAGLHLGVIAAGVEQGDLVITTPFSFIASANSILYERGVPVFVDVDPQTGNIDTALAAEAAEALTQSNGGTLRDVGSRRQNRWLPRIMHPQISKPQTLKAILTVHAFGQPCEMDALLAIAHTHQLRVIEDACEAIGAEYKERKAGTLGDMGVFAFYPNKQMTTGEGGMIVTNDDVWADLFRSLRNQGRDVFNAWLHHTRLGYNYRLDEMSAALGLSQFKRIDHLLANRARVASWYAARLGEEELIEVPHIGATTTRMSWFVYVVRIKPPVQREIVMRRLAEAGIPSRPYFTPIHLQPFYRNQFGYERGDFPVTEYLGDVSLALPFSGVMTEEQVDYVCQHLRASVTP